jgi:AraC family transcriptional regulator of adaptative response / DNA-3-methyladenine glycosylase II
VPGAWDGFEIAVRAILGQQVTVAGASTLAGRIARQFGARLDLPDPGNLTVLFPGPEALANAHLQGIPGARAQAIRALARATAAGQISFAGPADEAAAALARIPGVGDWTAQYVAMRALRAPDAFPAGDLVLRRIAGCGRPLSAAALRARAERWRPWRAYAAIYLWRAAADEASGEAAPGAAAVREPAEEGLLGA